MIMRSFAEKTSTKIKYAGCVKTRFAGERSLLCAQTSAGFCLVKINKL